MPNWTQGKWLSIGKDHINRNIFHINQSQLIITMNNDKIIQYKFRFLRTIEHQRKSEKILRIRAKSFEQW